MKKTYEVVVGSVQSGKVIDTIQARDQTFAQSILNLRKRRGEYSPNAWIRDQVKK